MNLENLATLSTLQLTCSKISWWFPPLHKMIVTLGSFPQVSKCSERFFETTTSLCYCWWKNSAPVDMVNIQLFTGFHTCQVVQDVFHQQHSHKNMFRNKLFHRIRPSLNLSPDRCLRTLALCQPSPPKKFLRLFKAQFLWWQLHCPCTCKWYFSFGGSTFFCEPQPGVVFHLCFPRVFHTTGVTLKSLWRSDWMRMVSLQYHKTFSWIIQVRNLSEMAFLIRLPWNSALHHKTPLSQNALVPKRPCPTYCQNNGKNKATGRRRHGGLEEFLESKPGKISLQWVTTKSLANVPFFCCDPYGKF